MMMNGQKIVRLTMMDLGGTRALGWDRVPDDDQKMVVTFWGDDDDRASSIGPLSEGALGTLTFTGAFWLRLVGRHGVLTGGGYVAYSNLALTDAVVSANNRAGIERTSEVNAFEAAIAAMLES